MIKEIEGDENKDLEKYAATDSPQYQKMVQMIADRFGLTSLKFNTLETLIEAIGLPKCKVCTHCFDGSSCFWYQNNKIEWKKSRELFGNSRLFSYFYSIEY